MASNVSAEMSGARRSAPRMLGALALGVVVGIAASYVAAVVATAQIPGDFRINPLTLVMIAALGALGVVTGWRWPIVGLTAGAVMLVLVGFAVFGGIAWTPSGSDWLNPFNAVAFGAASGYPAIVGAVLVTASVLSLRSRRGA